jgi:hypothetical protein
MEVACPGYFVVPINVELLINRRRFPERTMPDSDET